MYRSALNATAVLILSSGLGMTGIAQTKTPPGVRNIVLVHKVTLAVEKRRHKAEITIDPPNGPIIGLAQTDDMLSAINEALDHLQKQALKHKTKWLSKKRKAGKKFDGQSLEENLETTLGLAGSATVSVLVHKFPSVARTTEVHLVHAKDSVALRPMTLEEAIR